MKKLFLISLISLLILFPIIGFCHGVKIFSPTYVDGDGSTIFIGGSTRSTTTVNAATYDLLVTDYFLKVTYTATGAVTSLTLPTAQVIDGREIIIKDAGLNAATNNITVDTEGGALIDGAATAVISGDGDSINLMCDGTSWFVY